MGTFPDAVVFLKETIYFQFSWKQLAPRYIILVICFLLWNGMPVDAFFMDYCLLFLVLMPILSYTSLATDYLLVEIIACLGNRIIEMFGFEPVLEADALPLWCDQAAEADKKK